MNIRKATLEDSPGLAKVQVDSYRAAYAGIFPPSYLAHFTYEEQEQDWRDLLASEPADILLVAESSSGETVGYALGRPGLTDIPPYDCELVALHVRQASQRQGIGQQLIRDIARHLQQLGCVSLMLWTLEYNSVRLLYEQLGGQLIGEKEWDENESYGVHVKEVAYGWPHIQSLVSPSSHP